METGTNMLVDEVTQVPEQESDLSASIELCMSLAQEILASIDKALSMAQSSGCSNSTIGGPTDPPPSPRSLHSEITGQPFKAEGKEMIPKKRKIPATRTSVVKLGSGPEAEGPLDDGYSWRSFGQKKILGAKHPRGYYRCTHRNSWGCIATKLVQRSDDSPAIFNVTYSGTHTCDQKSSLPSPSPANTATLLSSFSSTLANNEKRSFTDAFISPPTSELNIFSSSPGRVSSYAESQSPQASSFSFPSTLESSCKRRSTDASISPATSDFNCFSSFSPGRVSSYVEPLSPQALKSDFSEMVSALTSENNLSVIDLDFPSESDHEFPF